MPVFKVVLQQTIRKWSVIKADNEQEALIWRSTLQ
jgi:hypothetical protein